MPDDYLSDYLIIQLLPQSATSKCLGNKSLGGPFQKAPSCCSTSKFKVLQTVHLYFQPLLYSGLMQGFPSAVPLLTE